MMPWLESDAAALVAGEGYGWRRDAGQNTQQSTLSRKREQVGFVDCGWLRMLPCLEPGVSTLVVGET